MFEHDGPGVSSSVGHPPMVFGGSAPRIASAVIPVSTSAATRIARPNSTTGLPVSAGATLDEPGPTATIGAAWPGD